MCIPEGGALKGREPEAVWEPKGNTQVKEPPLCKQLSFHFLTSFSFCRKEIFPWEYTKLRELPPQILCTCKSVVFKKIEIVMLLKC